MVNIVDQKLGGLVQLWRPCSSIMQREAICNPSSLIDTENRIDVSIAEALTQSLSSTGDRHINNKAVDDADVRLHSRT
jgi:hypothetical protein